MRRRPRQDLARRLERLERVLPACAECGTGRPGAVVLAWPGHDPEPCPACGGEPLVVRLAFDPT